MARRVPAGTVQTRTRRDQGMEHMVEATIRLLRERSPDQVTVRDVAEESGHHHRFVQAWFGGKVGLFRAVFDRMILEGAAGIQGPLRPSSPIGAELSSATVLMNWLVAAEPGSLDGPRPTPIIDQLIEVYGEQYGLDRDLARLMALRVVAASIAATLFAGPLGLSPDDVPAAVQLEHELAQLLAAARARCD